MSKSWGVRQVSSGGLLGVSVICQIYIASDIIHIPLGKIRLEIVYDPMHEVPYVVKECTIVKN